MGVAKEKIDATLRPIGDVGTRSEEAYTFYLQGSKDLGNFQYTKARESLEKAVEIDPEFAYAYLQAWREPTTGRAIHPPPAKPSKKPTCSPRTPRKKKGFKSRPITPIRSKITKTNGLAILKEFAAKYPKEMMAHDPVGLGLSCESNPDKAIEEFNIALSLDPKQRPP